MKLYKLGVVLLSSISLFGITLVAYADTPPPGTGEAPLAIRSGKLVVNPTTGQVIQTEVTQSDAAMNTTELTGAATTSVKQDGPPLTAKGSSLEGLTLQSDPAQSSAEDQLLQSQEASAQLKSGVSAASSTLITFENFEGGFPTAGWTPSGVQQWDDVACQPVDANLGGSHSIWPAVNMANPCNGEPYPNNMNASLMFGPFSLADAKTASLDFYFKIDSQSDGVCNPIANCDYLFWGASTNGSDFLGNFAFGSYSNGIFTNGYHFASLDLSFVAGQPNVWIGFAFVSNASGTGQGPFIDFVSLRKNSDARIYLTNENFEVTEFPNSAWESFDLDGATNGELFWDDVQLGQGGFNCLPRSGSWSLWSADGGANSINSCTGANYANNMKSWIVHGPFSLTGASEAWVDFYFRNQSEQNFDFLYWGASINGSNYYGPAGISGTQTGGPYGNGYNLIRFDLSNVFTLGDLRGKPQIWLAFIFESDGNTTDKGPFIDDVSVVIEGPSVGKAFLPVIIKNPAPTTPKTNLFINNQTGGTITNYRIFSPKLNGTVIPDIICSNIPAGATNFNCNATFDTSTYKVSTTNTCNPPTTTGQVTFKLGNDVRLIRCVGK